MSKPVCGWSLHEKIPSSLDVGHATIERIISALEANQWEGRDLFHIQLAIEEAIVNAITHGNKHAEGKWVELEIRVDPQTTFMRVKDQGAGFKPEKVPDLAMTIILNVQMAVACCSSANSCPKYATTIAATKLP